MKYSTKLLNFQDYRSQFIKDLNLKLNTKLNSPPEQKGTSKSGPLEVTKLITKVADLVNQNNSTGLVSFYYSITDSIKDTQIELIIKEYLFLKRVTTTITWKDTWITQVKLYYNRYDLVPKIEKILLHTTLVSPQRRESFSEYATRVTVKLREELLAPLKPKYDPVIHPTQCFIDLNYVKGDSPYNKGESFFLSDDQVLTSHLTPYFVKGKVRFNQLENALFYNKCYRRENPDKTHLCEFNQLEIHLKSTTENPPKELKEMFLRAYIILGLDPKYIEFRTTHYPYVSPAYQIYYTKDQFIELGGCGIMLNSVISNPDLYLAGAIGLERCYTLLYGLTTIAQVHPKIHR